MKEGHEGQGRIGRQEGQEGQEGHDGQGRIGRQERKE